MDFFNSERIVHFSTLIFSHSFTVLEFWILEGSCNSEVLAKIPENQIHWFFLQVPSCFQWASTLFPGILRVFPIFLPGAFFFFFFLLPHWSNSVKLRAGRSRSMCPHSSKRRRSGRRTLHMALHLFPFPHQHTSPRPETQGTGSMPIHRLACHAPKPALALALWRTAVSGRAVVLFDGPSGGG